MIRRGKVRQRQCILPKHWIESLLGENRMQSNTDSWTSIYYYFTIKIYYFDVCQLL